MKLSLLFGFSFLFMIARPFSAEAVAPSINLTVNGQKAISVVAGSQVTFQWSSSKTVGTLTASGGWSGQKSLNGSETITVSGTGAVSYTLTGKNKSGLKTATDSVTVTVVAPPTVTLLANGLPAETVQSGSIVTLSWTSENATSVVASGDWPGVGVKAASGLETVRVLVNSAYTLTATGAGGTAMSTVAVTVSDQPATRAIFKYLPYLAVGFDNPEKSVESIFTETFTNRMSDRRGASFLYLTPDGRRLVLNRLFANGAFGEASEGSPSLSSRSAGKSVNSFCKDNFLGNCPNDSFETGWARYAVTQTFMNGEFVDDVGVQISIQKRKADGDIASSFDEQLVEPATNWLTYARSTSTEDFGFAIVNPNPLADAVLEVKYFDSNSLVFGNDVRQPVATTEITILAGHQVIVFTSQLFGSLTNQQLFEGSLDIRVKSGPALALTSLKKEISSDGSVVLTGVSVFPGRQQ